MDKILQYVDAQELLALLFFIATWFSYTLYSKQANRHEASLLALTNRYRFQWMQQMLKRENRLTDANVLGNLMRSVTFFASTTIFFIIGLMSMLGYQDRAAAIVQSIPFAKPVSGFMWELKIFLLMIVFIYAFFKYSWSLRQYNFSCIFVASAPTSKEHIEQHEAIAKKGAYLMESAAEHFNNGLRAYYFGLAAVAWFVHPYLFMAATVLVLLVTYRREFASRTLQHLRT